MKYALDTDHLSLLHQPDGETGRRLQLRLAALDPTSVVTTVITYEEQTRGWLAWVAKANSMSSQVEAYARLSHHLAMFCELTVLPFDAAAAVAFQRIRSVRTKVGVMDLRIASIVIANDATLLTRNLRDFRLIPGLRAEDWSA
ncbi:MAG: type II toxin-antitoxin system VapC family toxin [Phycisphaerae bacterium]|nr:type II toxin-antitoxin system VapC family toxin [Tepidisphaeraceae bacterium]